MWLRHWKLSIDPFRPEAVGFISTSPHEDAVARLVHLADCGERRVELRGEGGLGKSVVLAEALRRLRRNGPESRTVIVRRPIDGASLIHRMAEGLGLRLDPALGRSRSLSRLSDAVRLARLQGHRLVMAVDDDLLLDDPEDRRLLDRIESLDPHPKARTTLIIAGRGQGDPDPWSRTEPDWGLSIRLERLTATGASDYLVAKLSAAGWSESPSLPFSPRAILRLHAITGGLPEALDRMAGLAMRAAAIERQSIVSPLIVEGVARECLPVPISDTDPIRWPN